MQQRAGENIQVRRAKIVEGENLAIYKHGLKIGVVVSYTGDADTGKGIATDFLNKCNTSFFN
jgi:elongation factor Ts